MLDVVPAIAGVRRTYGFDGANGAVHHSGVHLFEWRHVEYQEEYVCMYVQVG
jgi:hypothetical protein